MSAAIITPATIAAREVIRCGHCQLNQYVTKSGDCRRCHVPYALRMPNQLPHLAHRDPPHHLTIDQAVAQLVIAVRVAKGLSQRQLARRMDKPRTYISKVEGGKAAPHLANLQRFAEGLEIPLAAFLDLADTMTQVDL